VQHAVPFAYLPLWSLSLNSLNEPSGCKEVHLISGAGWHTRALQGASSRYWRFDILGAGICSFNLFFFRLDQRGMFSVKRETRRRAAVHAHHARDRCGFTPMKKLQKSWKNRGVSE
jgi:hypothetical protein